jgi:diguanylate cyclase (GGDEF)-like protein
MIHAPLPANEPARLAALRELGVLFTPAEERFDRITKLAAELLDVPIALVSLVAANCQWFKSSVGMTASETPRKIAFCAHAILGDDTLVVPDARLDPRFRDNPLVIGEPWVRFYAGHPLKASGGENLGTLCVIDRRPRWPTEHELDTLRSLAAWAENELRLSELSEAQTGLITELDELRERAMLDSMTQLWNRQAIMDILERELARSVRDESPIGVIMADIDHFKNINDTYGHIAGDQALHRVAACMRASVRPYDAIGRYGGEEFLIVLGNCDRRRGSKVAERIRRRVENTALGTPSGVLTLTVSLGLISGVQGEHMDVHSLVQIADDALYAAKAAGRNRFELGVPSLPQSALAIRPRPAS